MVVYRPLWMALGAVSFDLLLAIVLTSLLRRQVGDRIWRFVHWFTYVSWPLAVAHGLGTGSDSGRCGRGAHDRLLRVVALAGLVRIAGLAPQTSAHPRPTRSAPGSLTAR